MFFRKLISLMLLGLYGVPAAIGPHWHHHHGCSEHACVSTCSSSAEPHHYPSAHSCSCEHHVPASADKVADKVIDKKIVGNAKAKPTAWTASDRHGPCAICAFYASAQDLPLAFESASQNQLVTSVEPLEPQAPSTSATTPQARGPPVV